MNSLTGAVVPHRRSVPRENKPTHDRKRRGSFANPTPPKTSRRKSASTRPPSLIAKCPQRARRKRPEFLNQNIRPGKGENTTALRLKGNDSSACKQSAASLKGKVYLHDAPTHAACTPRPSRMFNNTNPLLPNQISRKDFSAQYPPPGFRVIRAHAMRLSGGS
jgi:hypothetical protein